jgi:hypothetical protein
MKCIAIKVHLSAIGPKYCDTEELQWIANCID